MKKYQNICYICRKKFHTTRRNRIYCDLHTQTVQLSFITNRNIGTVTEKFLDKRIKELYNKCVKN